VSVTGLVVELVFGFGLFLGFMSGSPFGVLRGFVSPAGGDGMKGGWMAFTK